MEEMIKILLDKRYRVNVINGISAKNSLPPNWEDKYDNKEELKKHFRNLEKLKKTYYVEVFENDINKGHSIIIDLSEENIIYKYMPNVLTGKVKEISKSEIIKELKKLPLIIDDLKPARE